MSDSEDFPPEELLARRHRQEKKHLQGEIVALKKSAVKGDKKRKKEIQDEIDRLTSQLTERQATELRDLEQCQNGAVSASATGIDEHIGQDDPTASETVEARPTKQSKAQKRREKKEAAERQHEAAVHADKKSAASSQRGLESSALNKLLEERQLILVPIPADGDCLYNAIAHQIQDSSGAELREIAADYLRNHRADFEPFLELEGTASADEMFAKYCDRVQGKQGPVWGGQPELRALSCALGRRIEVLQADGQPSTVFEPDRPSTLASVVITYHRHAYRLGEHYNSTEPTMES